jgi:hypothetical protein
MVLEGKGFYTWKIPLCEKGEISALVSATKAAGLTHVLVKIADGINPYNIDPATGVDYALLAIQALRSNGIQALGWQYCYGNNPIGEANIAIQRITQLNVDGFVIDAEEEYKAPGKKDAARRFMDQLRNSLPDLPIALSSYRYPSYHPALPWREFLDKCDFNMPQVYWMQAHNAGEQLAQSVRQFQALTPFRPIIPTGAAYREQGWQPTVEEVLDFLQTAKSLNLSAANFWEWSDARSGRLPGIWEAISDFSWTGEFVPKDICEKLILDLNSRDLDKLVGLYTPTAVHITSTRTVQGSEAIRNWYNILLNQILPNATFTLTSYSGSGNNRFFTWAANSSQGKVQNGSDTLGLADDKIAYHYSFFTASP